MNSCPENIGTEPLEPIEPDAQIMMLPKTEVTLAGGVWAILDHDYGETITAVYPTELEALRIVNVRGYGRVVAIAWGRDVRGEVVS